MTAPIYHQLFMVFSFCSVSHVKVLGRPLLSPFDVEIVDPSGRCTLKYNPVGASPESSSLSSTRDEEDSAHSRLRTLTARLMYGGVRRWEQMILSAILGAGVVVESDESDDEFQI